MVLWQNGFCINPTCKCCVGSFICDWNEGRVTLVLVLWHELEVSFNRFMWTWWMILHISWMSFIYYVSMYLVYFVAPMKPLFFVIQWTNSCLNTLHTLPSKKMPLLLSSFGSSFYLSANPRNCCLSMSLIDDFFCCGQHPFKHALCSTLWIVCDVAP